MRLRNDPNAKLILDQNQELVIKNPEKFKSKWSRHIFKNDNDLCIEIGTGKGNFILQMAKSSPNINFIAIEKYETVIALLVKKLLNEVQIPSNLKILVIDANNLSEVFDFNEVKRIYLNFSDPWPKARHCKRRLTHACFLQVYYDLLLQEGEIHLKTDNDNFFNYSKQQFQADNNRWNFIYQTNDLHNSEYNQNNFETEYETKFKREKKIINYIFVQKCK